MTFLIHTGSFKTIKSIFFFQNGDFEFFQVAVNPLPAIFDGLPYPPNGVPPIFIIKMTAKDVL